MPELTVETSTFPLVRTAYDRTRRIQSQYEAFWKNRRGVGLTPERLASFARVWLEVGAGSGDFCMEMARRHPDALLVAIERDRMRGKNLERRAKRLGLPNLIASRGNVMPTLIAEIPEGALDRIYVLYPCPWPKNSQRKNRWYNHPAMAAMVRALAPGGRLIWASDQRFYIDEARYASETLHGLAIETHGALDPASEGRTKFERAFLRLGQPCHELIAVKPRSTAP